MSWMFRSKSTLLVTILSAGCSTGPRQLTPTRTAEINKEVRAFAQDVARDVTQEGPTAWRRYFSESPEFFMAAAGHLAFPSVSSAIAAIPDLASTIKQIDLQWGEELRVDPLGPDLAVMATPYHEVRTNASGDRVNEA